MGSRNGQHLPLDINLVIQAVCPQSKVGLDLAAPRRKRQPTHRHLEQK